MKRNLQGPWRTFGVTRDEAPYMFEDALLVHVFDLLVSNREKHSEILTCIRGAESFAD